MTVLSSPSRIGRHLPKENPALPVVSPEWVSSSIDQGFVAPYEEFQIAVEEKFRPKKLFVPVLVSPPPNAPAGTSSGAATNVSDDEINTSDEEDMLPPGAGNLDPNYEGGKYECQRYSPVEHFNRKLIAELEILALDRELKMEEKHASGYRRAIAALRAYTRDIRWYKEAEKLWYIGPKIGSIIKEFMRKGKIAEVEKIKQDPKHLAALDLLRVHGAGPAAVKKWLGKGYTSVEGLVIGEGFDRDAPLEDEINVYGKRPSSSKTPAGPSRRGNESDGDDEPGKSRSKGLTEIQKKGIRWIDALNSFMAAAEVEEIHEIIREVVEKVCPGSTVDPVDEHRRGHRQNIRNADVLITPPSFEKFDGLFTKILTALEKRGVVQDYMQIIDKTVDFFGSRLNIGSPAKKISPSRSTPAGSAGGPFGAAPAAVPTPGSNAANALARLRALPPDQDPTERAYFICKVPSTGKSRPVHVYVTPPPCRPYCLVMLTGSELFVRSWREYLEKEKKWKISNHGLFTEGGLRLEDCQTEEEVFERCGLKWIPPEGRNA